MPIELKGNKYYSKVFKRVNYKLSNSTFWVVIKSLPIPCIFSHYCMIHWWLEHAHSFKKKKTKKKKKESTLICLYMISYSFRHLYHLLRTIYWYIYHWGFMWDFYESCCFLLLKISMHLECSDIMWEFFEILFLLDHG